MAPINEKVENSDSSSPSTDSNRESQGPSLSSTIATPGGKLTRSIMADRATSMMSPEISPSPYSSHHYYQNYHPATTNMMVGPSAFVGMASQNQHYPHHQYPPPQIFGPIMTTPLPESVSTSTVMTTLTPTPTIISSSSSSSSSVTPAHTSPSTSFKFPPKNECRVLILGCGTSPMGEDMINDGYNPSLIVNVDFSSVVIDQMNQKYNPDWDCNLASTKESSADSIQKERAQEEEEQQHQFNQLDTYYEEYDTDQGDDNHMDCSPYNPHYFDPRQIEGHHHYHQYDPAPSTYHQPHHYYDPSLHSYHEYSQQYEQHQYHQQYGAGYGQYMQYPYGVHGGGSGVGYSAYDVYYGGHEEQYLLPQQYDTPKASNTSTANSKPASKATKPVATTASTDAAVTSEKKADIDRDTYSLMEFICADATERLPFEDSSFDLIICKGTMDAVLCSLGSKSKAKDMVEESVRLLTNDGHGIFFLVSNGNSDNRIEFLEDRHTCDLSYYWNSVKTLTIQKSAADDVTLSSIPSRQQHSRASVNRRTGRNGRDGGGRGNENQNK